MGNSNKIIIVVALSLCLLKPLDSFFHQNCFHECDAASGNMDGYPLSTPGSTSYTSYLKHYYENLTSNFGMNYAGSCGYVAMASLLSYYDNYFNDSIVPEQYDANSIDNKSNLIDRANSPGVRHDDFTAMGHSDYNDDSDYTHGDDYLYYANQISGVSLHAKLVTIADQLGFYDSSITDSAASTASQRESVLNYYLSNVLNLSSPYQYSITTYELSINQMLGMQSTIRATIKSYIQSGHPVLIGVGDSSGGGHAVVAYDYDDIDIYCHPGLSYTGFSTRMTPSEMNPTYLYIRSYMIVDFSNISSNPGMNYIIQNFGDTSIYSLNSASINWTSTHNHSFTSYSNYSYYSHIASCSCGDFLLESHDIHELPPIGIGQPITLCSKCLRIF